VYLTLDAYLILGAEKVAGNRQLGTPSTYDAFALDEKLKFLESLRTFVQVEGMPTLKHAGESLDISKNTISTHLQTLNEMLECEVTTKGIAKTDAGDRIKVDARFLLDELEASLDSARTHLKRLAIPRFPVQVAMSPTIWMWGAEGELLPLTHSLPKGNAVEFLVANSDRVERAVADGWFELGITARHPTRELHGKLAHRPFCSDEIVLAVPPGHEWSDAEEVAAGELGETPVIMLDPTANARRVVDRALEREGLELAEPHEEVAMAVMAFDEARHSGVPALVSRLAFESPRGRAATKQGFSSCRVSGVDLSRDFLLVHRTALRDEAGAVMDVLLRLMSK
jgi:DNA-binding transcriptional LysR family regulator